MISAKGFLAVAACVAGAVAVPAIGQAGRLAMLDTLEPGSWALRLRGAGSGEDRVCVRSGRELIQLRHPGEDCRQIVVADRPGEVTVQYTCPGRGYGRTTIRRETDGLIQLDSQGIRAGHPFAFAAEGRRVGACAP